MEKEESKEFWIVSHASIEVKNVMIEYLCETQEQAKQYVEMSKGIGPAFIKKATGYFDPKNPRRVYFEVRTLFKQNAI